MIDVALCFHDSTGFYYRKATTTILSIFDNTKARVHIHIVHDETLPFHHQSEMNNVAELYGQKISFYTAPHIDDEVASGVTGWLGVGRGTLYRLFLHQLTSLSKIIYLDCDIICEHIDIQELFNNDLGELPLAAVREANFSGSYAKRIEVDAHNYFNAGVLLLNLDWLRKHGDELMQMMINELKYRKKLLWADQDILNIFFTTNGRKILYLDEKFNYMIWFDGRHMQNFSDYSGKILHLGGRKHKPWDYFSNSSLLYWKYYSKTPWGSETFTEIMKTINDKEIDIYRFLFQNDEKYLPLARRFYDYKTLGFLGYLKKRLFHKSLRKKEN